MAQVVSLKYTEQLPNLVRWARGYIEVVDTETIIADTGHLIAFKIQGVLPNAAKIFGNTIARYAEIKIQNPGNTTYNTYTQFLGKRIDIYVGITLDIGEVGQSVEYVKQGEFIVFATHKDTNNESVVLECYDGMIQLNQPYVELGTYPMTLADLADSVAAAGGLELGSTTFGNSTFSLTEQPNLADGEYTLRNVMGWIAELAGGNAVIGRDGKLYVVNYGTSSAYTISKEEYYEFSHYSATPAINSVIMNRVALGDEVHYPAELPSPARKYTISDNMVAYDQREDIIAGIYGIVNGLTYVPFKLNWRGTGHLEFMDKITIVDLDDTSYVSFITEKTLVFDGELYEEYSTATYNEEIVDFINKGNQNTLQKYTEAKVDKVAGEITLIASGYDEISSDYAQILLDMDSINSSISTTNQNLETLQSDITQTATDLTLAFTDIDEIKSYYQFTADSLTIGKTDSPAQIKIGYEVIDSDNVPYITLTDGANNTAKIQSNNMTIQNVNVQYSATIGQHKITRYDLNGTDITIVQKI